MNKIVEVQRQSETCRDYLQGNDSKALKVKIKKKKGSLKDELELH